MPAEVAEWFRYLCNKYNKGEETGAEAFHRQAQEAFQATIDPITGMRMGRLF